MLAILSTIGYYILAFVVAVTLLFIILFATCAVLAIFGGTVYIFYFIYEDARQDRIKEEKLLKSLEKRTKFQL